MNNKNFIEVLNKDSPNESEKLECCQFYIDYFPVQIEDIKQTGPFVVKTGKKFWTKLDIKIEGGLPSTINHAFNQLVKRKSELKEFLNKLNIK